MDGLSRLNLVGSSPAFQQVLHGLHRLAGVDATVLISGESGTGKELAARAMHYIGPRSDKPFVPVNCGALADTLIESELFGHERGAFTDARTSQAGLVAEAQGGTLFLDEIDTLSAKAQGALLRFLQDKTYRRLGGGGEKQADVRVIVATNADLAELADAKQFRQDLYYRLNVLNITLPPLRERDNDAVELARVFLARLCSRYKKPDKQLHAEAIAFIQHYPWPGNVRELENVLHRDFLMGDGDMLYCTEARSKYAQAANPVCLQDGQLPFREAKAKAVEEFERHYVGELLAKACGCITKAANLAGKDRSAFGKLVRKYQMADAVDQVAPNN